MEMLHQFSQEQVQSDQALNKKSRLRRRPSTLYATYATQV